MNATTIITTLAWVGGSSGYSGSECSPRRPHFGLKMVKRRCTNSKCKILLESTGPIFRCPHRSGSIVRV